MFGKWQERLKSFRAMQQLMRDEQFKTLPAHPTSTEWLRDLTVRQRITSLVPPSPAADAT